MAMARIDGWGWLVMYRNYLVGLVVLCMSISMVGCSIGEIFQWGEGGSDQTGTPSSGIGPRVITGDEALELYGVGREGEGTEASPTKTPEVWFPMTVWVAESLLPYDPDETIKTLPIFSTPGLSEGGTWLGDLEAGAEITLWTVFPDGSTCFVEGQAMQGWPVKGWVACNRLRFLEE